MKVKKLLKVVNESLPINFYKYGEYIGQFTASGDYANVDIDEKIESINALVLTNGKPCLQVYLKGNEDKE
jgi:hypothetical protein